MFEDYSVTNYGMNDLATGHYIKKFAEDLKHNTILEEILNTLNSDIGHVYQFERLLKIKVLFEYRHYVSYLNSPSVKKSLSQFYEYFSSLQMEESKLKGKVIKFINQNAKEIFSSSTDPYVQDESLNIAIKNSGGIKAWKEIIETADRFILFNKYDDLYQIFYKKQKDNLIDLTKKVLTPVSMTDYDTQIEIALRINKKFPDIFKVFQKDLIELIESKFFEHQSPFEKVKLMNDVLGSRVLGVEGEILIKDKLRKEEDILDNQLEKEGISQVISSEEYAKIEKQLESFIEKFYILTYIDSFSRYRLMQYEEENNQSIVDLFSNSKGIKHAKYGKNSFIYKFKNMTYENILNTMYLLTNYDEKFWEELITFSNDIAVFTGISDFLPKDIKQLKRFIEDDEYFHACSFISQLIERLLRELFLKLMYGESGNFKEAKFTLGNLLDFKVKPEFNKLLLLFSKEELETMDYYLTNDEYGWNLRNRLAHYNIEMDELTIEDFSCLLHLLIFILVKIEYQGTAFDEDKPHLY